MYLLEKSGEFENGSRILKNLRLQAYDFATLSASGVEPTFPNQVQYLIVSLHWDAQTDRAIEKYLNLADFSIFRNQPRSVGGLGYRVYKRS